MDANTHRIGTDHQLPAATADHNDTLGAAAPEYVFPHWRGYNLEQLHYRLSLNMARREIAQFQLQNTVQMYKNDELALATGKNSMVKRMLASLNLIDYAAIAISVGRKIYAIYKHFKD